MTHELVDPRGEPARVGPSERVVRPGTVPSPLEIGFLVNEVSRQTGPDFTRYTLVLERRLRERFGDVRTVREAKPVLSRPADRAMLERFRHCRGVVSGLAK